MILLAAALTALPFAAAQSFDSPQEITSALRGQISLASGDIDGDGRLDLIAASDGLERVLWFRGKADGTVASGPRVAADGLGRVQALAAADLDLDGDLDIVAIANDGREALWLRGDGLGGFEVTVLAEGLLGLGVRIYVLDHDEDGDLDVVAMRQPGGGFNRGPILVDGQGAGVFAPPTELLDLDQSYTDLVQFDVDGDGRLDLILSGTAFPTSWFRQPSGPGQPWTATPFSLNPWNREWDLKAGDLDGDGDLDLAATGFNNFRTHFFENLGNGSFGPQISLGEGTGEREDLALVDVDLDGDLDVVETRAVDEAPVWLENQGGFQFVDRGEFLDPGSATGVTLHTRDMNEDGRVDLAIAASSTSLNQVLGSPASTGGLGLDPTPIRVDSLVPSASGAVALDVNGDALPDVVTASAIDGLGVARGLGAARFDRVAPLLVGAPGTGLSDPIELMVADLDGDGLDDLLVRRASGDIAWLRFSGSLLEAPELLGTSGSLPVGPWTVGDFDGDGDEDVLFVNAQRSEVIGIEQTAPGQFASAVTLGIGPAPIRELQLTDVQGDGVTDLVLAAGLPGDASLGWLPGLGGGVFDFYGLIRQDSEVLGLIARDIDADGDVDLSWFRPSPRLLMRARNEGAGSFSAAEVVGRVDYSPEAAIEGPGGEPTALLYSREAGTANRWIEWIDLTGNDISVLSAQRISLRSPASLVLAHVTDDEDLDVLATSGATDQIVWLEGRERTRLGANYCGPAVLNSSGSRGRIEASGISAAAENTLRLNATDLPAASTTLFLASRDAGFVLMPAGSLGNLCLGGAVGRFARPGEPGQTSPAGFVSLNVDLTDIPQPQASVAALAGETWRFQAWYRDAVGGVGVSNFTDGVEVDLR